MMEQRDLFKALGELAPGTGDVAGVRVTKCLLPTTGRGNGYLYAVEGWHKNLSRTDAARHIHKRLLKDESDAEETTGPDDEKAAEQDANEGEQRGIKERFPTSPADAPEGGDDSRAVRTTEGASEAPR